MRTLGLIPARAGSKGLPGKNLRPLAGKPPVQWAFDAACDAESLQRVILSTDDAGALRLAERIGLEVPFVRPQAFATDDTPMIDVVLHALSVLEAEGDRFDAVCVLQPTSPLRTGAHIDAAAGLLRKRPDASAVCSVTPVPLERCPHYLMALDEDDQLKPFMPDGDLYTRRQDVPRAYQRCGTVFLTRVSVLREARSFYGRACLPMVLNPDEVVNIDGIEDWRTAEAKLQHRLQKGEVRHRRSA